ncbi:winged helix DNA-binding domain-containing protein [Nonomuraea pusilla]|uniref:winged helix DNA-binding domain-containing protein n=1 Tax=Nonomuraea pusilla TaxID=46177 RepID=UPI0033236DE0
MRKKAEPVELSWEQVSARRLERAGLGARRRASAPAAVAAAMCGVHAQVMSAAELSLGLRAPGLTRSGVRAALWEDRELVRTYGPRGTVHLLPAADLPLWLDAMSSLPSTRGAGPEGLRLTPEQTELVVRAVADAVAGAELTIDELDEAVVAAAGPWAGDLVMPAFQTMWPRWRQVMAVAAHRGAFVFGPGRGRKVTYTAAPAVPAAAGGRDHLVRSYLWAYGPATPEDFARWTAAPVRWAAEAFAAAGAEEVRFEGRRAWVAAGDTEAPAEPPSGVRLLPHFDAYVVAGRPRELLYAGPAAARALNRGQAGNHPVLLVDGVVAGVWHGRRSGRTLHVTVEPLDDLGGGRTRALGEEVERVAAVLECEARLTIGTVTVGPHA